MPLSLIIAILRETFGLDVASVGITLIERVVKERVSVNHLPNISQYADLLQNCKLGRQNLVEAVVGNSRTVGFWRIPETFFFRYPQSFAARKPMPDLTFDEQLADKGELREAAEICEVSLFHHGPSARVFHLLGLLHDCAGDQFHAGEFYRKALYLDPDHYDALIHLALLEDKSGRFAVAKLLKNRARRRGAQAPGRRRLRRRSTTGPFLWQRGQRREIIEISSRSQSNR